MLNSTQISGLALLLQDRYLRCKTGLGSRKGRFAPETLLVNQSQYQIGKINSEMYVRRTASAARRPTKMEVPRGEGPFLRELETQSLGSAGMMETLWYIRLTWCFQQVEVDFKRSERGDKGDTK